MIIVVLFLLGLCIGSFINALVWRVYMQSESSLPATKNKRSKAKKKPISKDKYSILNGRSMCTECGHTLKWQDLVPVVSWLSLGGKCRYCRKSISWQYPLVEVVTALLFVASYIFWPTGGPSNLFEIINFGLWLVVLTGFIALTVYDLRWMLLPNRIVYPLIFVSLVMALLSILSGPSSQFMELAINTIFSVMISGGLFFLIFQFSGGRWIGGGDVKLGILIGLLMHDPFKAFLVLFLASVMGTLFVLPGLMMGVFTNKTKIPFGPFLIVAATISFIFGNAIIDWYKFSVLLIG